jgi:cyclase
MRTKKIIPCLDIYNGKVVKGINFAGLREVGNPLEYALKYACQGADEIAFLNISANEENKQKMVELIEKVSKHTAVPIIVGGGIESLEDISALFNAGASKASINSGAFKRPKLISDAVARYGSERIVIAIDGKRNQTEGYDVMISGGKVSTEVNLIEWAVKVESLGAGEILLTSMDADGVKTGFDIEMLKKVCDHVKIPVIASGGCGEIGHFVEVFNKTSCESALAASIFHYDGVKIGIVKEALMGNGIRVSLKEKRV